MTQPGKCPALTTPRNGRTPDLAEVRGLPWCGVGTRNPNRRRPALSTPPPVLQLPTPCLGAGFGRYCTYSAGFTHSGGSRNPWSQCFGWCGYCTYPPNTCRTRIQDHSRPSPPAGPVIHRSGAVGFLEAAHVLTDEGSVPVPKVGELVAFCIRDVLAEIPKASGSSYEGAGRRLPACCC